MRRDAESRTAIQEFRARRGVIYAIQTVKTEIWKWSCRCPGERLRRRAVASSTISPRSVRGMRVTVCDYRRQYFAALCLIGTVAYLRVAMSSVKRALWIHLNSLTAKAILPLYSIIRRAVRNTHTTVRAMVLLAIRHSQGSNTAMRTTFFTFVHIVPTCSLPLNLKHRVLALFQIRHVIARRHAAHWWVDIYSSQTSSGSGFISFFDLDHTLFICWCLRARDFNFYFSDQFGVDLFLAKMSRETVIYCNFPIFYIVCPI